MWSLPTPALWNKKEENGYAIGTDGKRMENAGCPSSWLPAGVFLSFRDIG